MRKWFVAAAMVFAAASVASGTSCSDVDACSPRTRGDKWLATGHVSKVDGPHIYFLGKDNVVYAVDSRKAEVVFDGFESGCRAVQAGDRLRVFGTITGECKVEAARVRVFARETAPAIAAGPQREVRIVVEKERPAPVVCDGCQVGSGGGNVTPPCVKSAWEGRGLVSDIDYQGRRLKVQTSCGPFSINTCDARLVSGCQRIPFAVFNLGDSVKVTGDLVGLNEIEAREVNVMRTRSDAENALPQKPVSVAGVIQQIDYPSLTFKLQTEGPVIVVSVDDNTTVQQNKCRMAFRDLREGMRVKMSGNGSLGTGYSAKHIQIISIAP